MEIPVLTEQQIKEATQLLSSHPLGERLAKYAYTISQIGPWVDESYGIRGAGMALSAGVMLFGVGSVSLLRRLARNRRVQG